MKRIEAYIKPFRMEELRVKLADLNVGVIRTLPVQELNRPKYQEIYRGTEYEVDDEPRILVILLVDDSQEDQVVKTIQSVASTGNAGDGLILVMPVHRVAPVDAEDYARDPEDKAAL